MFSLVQTVRYYQSRFIFLFAWRSFGVDFVSLILQHARHFLSLSSEREMRSLLFERDDDLMGKEIWRKAFKERQSKDEIVLSETTRARLSLVPLSRALKPFKEERKRERDWCAFRKKREILIAGGGFKIAPERSASSRARTRCALFLSLSLHHLLHFTAFISSFASDSEVVCFRARFSRTIHSPYS